MDLEQIYSVLLEESDIPPELLTRKKMVHAVQVSLDMTHTRLSSLCGLLEKIDDPLAENCYTQLQKLEETMTSFYNYYKGYDQ